MGTFALPIRVASMGREESRAIEAIVDTGAAYTTLPGRLLREMGVEPIGQRRFLLADGRRAILEYGRAWVTVEEESEVTLVVFGEDDGPALLGAYTLEGLALAVDPVEQQLVPTQLILYQMASDLDWEKWDRQLEADVRDGRLDFLIAEALEAKEDGTLQKL